MSYKVTEHSCITYYKDPKHTIVHREDGPAYISNHNTKYWFYNGKLHRTDSPAVEGDDGFKYWYFNNKHYRLDGPSSIGSRVFDDRFYVQ